jgi:hypothetical protein
MGNTFLVLFSSGVVARVARKDDFASQVMAGIRAVERLVAEREVGDDVALDRSFEQRPLKP